MEVFEKTGFEDPFVMNGQVEEIVCVIDASGPAYNMVSFVEKMKALLDRVPEAYRSQAEIQFKTWEDRDDFVYGRLAVSYQRPATDTEIERERQKTQEAVLRDRSWLQNRMDQLIEDAERAGMSAADIGLVQSDGGYVIERRETEEEC